MRFYRLPYNADTKVFWFSGEPVVSFFTKVEAQTFARSISWPVSSVRRIGNRFMSAWALYHKNCDAFVGECPVLDMFKIYPWGYTPIDHSSKLVNCG